MADNKDLKGQQDRSRVAGDENYEIQYLSQQLGVPADKVREAIAAVGNSREKIEAYIKAH